MFQFLLKRLLIGPNSPAETGKQLVAKEKVNISFSTAFDANQ